MRTGPFRYLGELEKRSLTPYPAGMTTDLPSAKPATGHIAIRPLQEADVSAFKALRVRGLRDEPLAFGTSAEEVEAQSEAAIVQEWRDSAQVPGNVVVGAFLDGAMVGIVGLRRETKTKLSHKALLWGMYVAPEAQGRGIGRALVDHVIAGARQVAGLEQIQLVVTSDLATPKKLYERIGFVSYGIEPRSLKLPDGYRDAEEMVFWL
jgi:ribosomal protein S18 acetylase RimI-like enzyme